MAYGLTKFNKTKKKSLHEQAPCPRFRFCVIRNDERFANHFLLFQLNFARHSRDAEEDEKLITSRVRKLKICFFYFKYPCLLKRFVLRTTIVISRKYVSLVFLENTSMMNFVRCLIYFDRFMIYTFLQFNFVIPAIKVKIWVFFWKKTLEIRLEEMMKKSKLIFCWNDFYPAMKINTKPEKYVCARSYCRVFFYLFRWSFPP